MYSGRDLDNVFTREGLIVVAVLLFFAAIGLLASLYGLGWLIYFMIW